MAAGPDLSSKVEQNRAEILDLVRRHRGRSIAVFGSVARGEATSESDIDFLVEFEPSSSLLDFDIGIDPVPTQAVSQSRFWFDRPYTTSKSTVNRGAPWAVANSLMAVMRNLDGKRVCPFQQVDDPNGPLEPILPL